MPIKVSKLKTKKLPLNVGPDNMAQTHTHKLLKQTLERGGFSSLSLEIEEVWKTEE